MFIQCSFKYRDWAGNQLEEVGYVLNENTSNKDVLDKWIWSDEIANKFIDNSNIADRFFNYQLSKDYSGIEIYPQGEHKRNIWSSKSKLRTISTTLSSDIQIDWSNLIPKSGEVIEDKTPSLVIYRQEGKYMFPKGRLEKYDKNELKKLLGIETYMNIPVYKNIIKGSLVEEYIKENLDEEIDGELSWEWSTEFKHEFI